MSEKKPRKSNEYEEKSSESKDNLKELLKKSLLLNVDIFSSEFEDEYEKSEVELEIQEIQEIEPEKTIIKAEELEGEYEEDSFIKDLANRELKIDFEKADFVLDIEKSTMDKNENFKLFPKIKIDRPERMNKAIKKTKTSKTRVKENLSMDTNFENKKVEKTRQDILKDKEGFFSIEEVATKKLKTKEKYQEAEKIDKSQVKIKESFHINKIDSKEIKAKARSKSKFSVQSLIRGEDMFNIDLNQNKDSNLLSKSKKDSIYNSFNEEEKFSSRAKNNLKIEGL